MKPHECNYYPRPVLHEAIRRLMNKRDEYEKNSPQFATYDLCISELRLIGLQSLPLTPLLEKAWDDGINEGIKRGRKWEHPNHQEQTFEQFLNSDIL